jgi:hypothetical protein
MQSIKSLFTPFVVAAVLGLGVGFGASSTAQAAPPTCYQICAAEFRECRAADPSPHEFFICRGIFSACVRAC